MSIYRDHGFHDRRDYLRALADEYDVPYYVVLHVYEILGPGEDFDGLIIALQDNDYSHAY